MEKWVVTGYLITSPKGDRLDLRDLPQVSLFYLAGRSLASSLNHREDWKGYWQALKDGKIPPTGRLTAPRVNYNHEAMAYFNVMRRRVENGRAPDTLTASEIINHWASMSHEDRQEALKDPEIQAELASIKAVFRERNSRKKNLAHPHAA